MDVLFEVLEELGVVAIPLDADFEVEEVAVELGVFDLFLGEGKEVSAKHGVQEVTEEAVFAVKEFFWTAGTSAQGAAVRVKEFIIAFEFVEEGVVVKVVEGLDAAEKVLEVASGLLDFGELPKDLVEAKLADGDVVFVGDLDPVVIFPDIAARSVGWMGRFGASPEQSFFFPRADRGGRCLLHGRHTFRHIKQRCDLESIEPKHRALCALFWWRRPSKKSRCRVG